VKRQHLARILTVALMAGALAVVAVRNTGRSVAEAIPAIASQPKLDPSPQDAIYAMLDAARDGNVAAYLGAFSGQMEISLRQSAAEQGDAAFANYLKDANAPVKGIAIMEPQPVTDGEVRVKVEYVYSDRNEAQWFHLVQQSDKTWKITRLDTAERVKTLVPYGSPANQ
jgi:hypothetical protein